VTKLADPKFNVEGARYLFRLKINEELKLALKRWAEWFYEGEELPAK
jgi:hypothetical protein